MNYTPIKPLEKPTLNQQLRLIGVTAAQAVLGLVINFAILASKASSDQLASAIAPLAFVYSAYVLLVPAFGYFFSYAGSRVPLIVFPSMWPATICTILLVSQITPDWAHPSVGQKAIQAFFFVAIPEEAIKMGCYLIPLFYAPKIRYGYHLIFSAAVAGLSFGVLENGFYVTSPKMGDPITTAYVRFALTTLLHASFCMIGATIITYKMCGVWQGAQDWMVYTLALIVPAIGHGAYDFVLFLNNETMVHISVVIAIVCYLAPFAMTIPLRRATTPLPVVARTSEPAPVIVTCSSY